MAAGFLPVQRRQVSGLLLDRIGTDLRGAAVACVEELLTMIQYQESRVGCGFAYLNQRPGARLPIDPVHADAFAMGVLVVGGGAVCKTSNVSECRMAGSSGAFMGHGRISLFQKALSIWLK